MGWFVLVSSHAVKQFLRQLSCFKVQKSQVPILRSRNLHSKYHVVLINWRYSIPRPLKQLQNTLFSG